MTDPTDALLSFQAALSSGTINLQRGEIDREIFVHLDHPNGRPRFTYVRLSGLTVTALAMFVIIDQVAGLPRIQTGYAVPKDFRGQGRAKDIMLAAIAELQNGLARANVETFVVEAVVGTENFASQHVASSILTTDSVNVTDIYTGLPALQYVRTLSLNASAID